MNANGTGKPLVAQIVVHLHPDGTVSYSYEARSPSVNLAVMMLERAKLQLFVQGLRAEEEAAKQVIETPTRDFDPGTYVGPNLRLAL